MLNTPSAFVLSRRAADAVRALIAPGVRDGSRDRLISAPERIAKPMAFDVREFGGNAEIFLPGETPALVVGPGISRAADQVVGTEQSGWVSLGALPTSEAWYRSIYLEVRYDIVSGSDYGFVWRIYLATSIPTGNSRTALPVVPIARIRHNRTNRALNYGVRQYHRGVVNISHALSDVTTTNNPAHFRVCTGIEWDGASRQLTAKFAHAVVTRGIITEWTDAATTGDTDVVTIPASAT